MISVSHLTALDARPEGLIRAAAAAGFQGVGLRVLPPRHAPGLYPVAGDPVWCRELRKLADDAGIRVFEAESFAMDHDSDVAAMEPGLEAAAVLGASVLVSGGADPHEARLTENYARLAELAAGYGIVMAIEFMPSRPMKTLSDARRVMARVGHPNARLLIDVLHLCRSGSALAELATLTADQISHVHLCDAPAPHPGQAGLTAESREGRLYPGEGGLPVVEILAALPRDVPISLEAPHRDQQHLAPEERIARAGAATLAFLDGLRRRPGPVV